LKTPLKRKSEIVAILLLAALLTFAHLANNVRAQECSAIVEVAAEVQPSTSFNVSIIAENIPTPGMYGWELILSWTPGKINYTAETLNYDFWPSNGGPMVSDPADNTAGTYHQALSARNPSNPVTGTYWLVNVTFLPIAGACNSTSLTLGPAPGLTYLLVDKTATEIPHLWVSGSTHIIPEFLETLLLPLLMTLSAASMILAAKMRKRQ
jgi:hypothetical protein